MSDHADAGPILFKDDTSAGLHARLAPLGVSARLARRLQAAVLRTGAVPAALPEVPRRLLDAGRAATEIPRLTLVEKAVSAADGFTKYLFRCAGPATRRTSSASARRSAAPWAAPSAPPAAWASAATWRRGRSWTRWYRCATTRRTPSAASSSWAWASRC